MEKRTTEKVSFVAGVHSYKNPIIPNGWKYVVGEWNDGFVIRRDCDGSEMVWIPIEQLPENGSLDGKTCNQKFGRRNFEGIEELFEKEMFVEDFSEGLAKQQESVAKYGGFYISRYAMSATKDKKLISRSMLLPCRGLRQDEAIGIAKTFEEQSDVKSHLVYGAEYDSMLEWFIESKARIMDEIVAESSWGNYKNVIEDNGETLLSVMPGGCDDDWCTNRIYDVAGNIYEWTQEKFCGYLAVARGGSFQTYSYETPASFRAGIVHDAKRPLDIGFRVALYIK